MIAITKPQKLTNKKNALNKDYKTATIEHKQ